jgi:amino acid adenylation domain-containing protein
MTAAVAQRTSSLTPLQEGMLFHGRLAAGVYVQQLVVTLPEELDTEALRRAWQIVAGRHAALRMAFPADGVATVADEIEVRWAELDLSGGRSADAWLIEDRRRGLDLSAAPLWRLTLVRRGPADQLLVWTFHHALLDGRSHRRVLEEVFAAYEAICEKVEPALEPGPPFFDHVEWLGRQDSAAAERYWRSVLAGFETPMTINVSCPGTAVEKEPPPGEQAIVIPGEIATGLKDFAAANDVSPTTLVHAAWAILLARYGGQTDVVFGGTRSGGGLHHKDSVGLFVNTLPVRARVDGDKRLGELLSELRGQWRNGRDFAFAAPVDVQSWAGLPAGAPLYETIVVTENYELDEAVRSLGGAWEKRSVRLHEEPHYPLALTVAFGRATRMRLLYDRRRLDDATAGRLLRHLRTLLEALPGHADALLRDLPMLTPAERQRIVFEWNDTAGDYPRDRRLEQLFEEQVDRTPDGVAVVHDGQSWTYRELDERANRLARHLARLGAGPGKMVAVCMNRSADMLAAVLAILKSGAAYVPLDPAYPKERLSFLLGDTGAVAMLTQVRRIAQLPELAIPVVCIDADWPTIGLHMPERLPRKASAGEMAYVIYTSGSTGQPKGVVLRHRAVVNTIDWVNKTFDVGPRDRVLWVTSLCFDLSVYDIFGVLAAGGSVRVATGSELRDPERLTAVLDCEPITIWDSAPSLLDQLAPHFEKVSGRAARLRLVMLSGDWIPVALPDQVRTAFPAARVVSLGGATEAAIWSNWYPVDKVDPEWASIPYGRPIRNARYYLLDVHGQPAPVGVPADLFIAGDCVADGYWNRPELTAERFIIEPFASSGERMYRTGDLAKFWPDGTIEFLGRRDSQVKIRGFRIELGEVEATLTKHPAVERAVAVVTQDAGGEKQLVAYIVPRAGQDVTAADVRRFVREQLPEYLVPAHVVTIDALPLNSNGKVDRKALAASLKVESGSRDAMPPRDATEATLAAIWQEVLGVPACGVHDNFFELGGHSLKAAQVVSRVRQRLGKELPLAAFFRSPTIADAAQALRAVSVNAGSLTGHVAHAPRSDRALAGPTQRQIWFLHQLGQGSEVYNIAYDFALDGPLNVPALRAALDGVVARHDGLRTTFEEDGGRLWQIVVPPAVVKLSVTDLSADVNGERTLRQLAGAFAREPFDFRRGPLLRARLVRLGETEHRLLLCWHHLILDGQSFTIFLRDLAALYSAAVGGSPIEMPAAPSFEDDSRRAEADVAGRLPELLAHWTKKLSLLPPPVTLPGAKLRPAAPTFRGDVVPLGLTPETAGAVAALARKEVATPFTVLLAAFQAVIHRLTGQADFTIGAPVTCRTRPGSDDVVGPLVNTIVLRADLSGEPTFADLLARTRRAVHDALAHQEMPFDLLVGELRPGRSRGGSPLFNVLFNYNPGAPLPPLPGIEWAAKPVPNGTSKFDLSLVLDDVPPSGSAGGRLVGHIEYGSELFDAVTIERFAGHFRTLLSAALANPDASVGRLPLLTDVERRQILNEWNATAVDHPTDPAHRLIAGGPAAGAAVRHGRRSLTYAELNRSANRLAHHLRSLGVGRDVPVGIGLERSADWVVAALAVWKAGGAYLPLDPRYPAERLALVLRDARAPVLITRSDVELPATEGNLTVVQLDDDAATIAEQPDTDPGVAVTPDDMAYIIYTSGSTGTPKGVMIRHGGLSNLLAALRRTFSFGPGDRFLAIGTPAFDVHVLEVWHALTAGAELVIGGPDAAADGRVLARLLRQNRLTVVHATPTTWRLLLAAGWEGDPQLTAVCGGEEVTPDLAAALLPKVRGLWNMYGPTEITVAATWCQVTVADGPVPIGRPIDNMRAYVLDPRGEPVPAGIVGELFLAGAGVSRGYLGRPDLTAERFLPEIVDCRLQFNGSPPSAMYRTGDLASWRPDGCLVYHGRCDHQVKIRGHRIELGEIEAAVGKHPAVAQAAAAARRDAYGGDSLWAYIVPRAGRKPVAEEIRNFLRASLPEYMVPSAVMLLDRLPLAPGGKLDRAALQALDSLSAATHRKIDRTPPRNDIERDLVAIWSEVLKTGSIGVTDDFFELGGHSYQAAVLLTRVQERLGHSLPLGTLFAAPTVEKLAAVLQKKLETGSAGSLVPLHEAGHRPPLFLIAGIGGHVFTFHKFARLLGPDQPAYGVKAIGVDGSDRTPDRIEDIAARYVKEIVDERPDGPIVLGGYSIGALVAFELALQLQAAGRPVGPLVVFDSAAPGYPRPKPLPSRLLIHVSTMITGRGVDRAAYFRERLQSIRRRFLKAAGLISLSAPRIEGLDALPQDALRQVWLSLQKALDRYRPRGQFEGPVLLFKATATEAWRAAVYEDPLLGWERWATGRVEPHPIPGGHLEMFSPANLAPLATTLRERLTALMPAEQAIAAAG